MKVKHDAQGPRFEHECSECKPHADKDFRILMSCWEAKKNVMSLHYKKFCNIADARDCMKELELDKLWAGYEFTVIKVTGVTGYNAMEVVQ